VSTSITVCADQLLLLEKLMGTVDKRISRSGIVTHRARVRIKGARPETATFASKTEAKKWVAIKEGAIHDGRHFPVAESRRHTLADLIDRYQREVLPFKPRSRRSRQRQLDRWKRELGALRLCDVTSAAISQCKDKLLRELTHRGTNRTPATVNRYLAAISHPFTIAMREWGWVEDNPCRKVAKLKEPRGRVRFLDDDERGRLFAACRDSKSRLLYPIVLLAVATGMRKGEIRTLRRSQVDFDRGVITLHETKNDERRIVPLSPAILDALRERGFDQARPGDLLFPNTSGAAPIEIDKAWNTALNKSGITHFRFHDLRHTAASYMAQGGATSIDIATVLGHKTLSMVKRYAHLGDSDVKHVIVRMNERLLRTRSKENSPMN
jgi:integrase